MFIVLHYAKDSSPVIINAAQLRAVNTTEADAPLAGTRILFDDNHSYIVKEDLACVARKLSTPQVDELSA